MSLRFGLLDLVGVIVVALVLLMPAATRKIEPLYDRRERLDRDALALAQAEAMSHPDDGAALLRYADNIAKAEQTDMALRLAGARADQAGPDQWRAVLTVASVHADRLEAQETHDWTARALEACDRTPDTCPGHERVRIELYKTALKSAIDKGFDPRRDPAGFRAALDAAVPTVHVGGRKNNKPPKDMVPPAPAPERR